MPLPKIAAAALFRRTRASFQESGCAKDKNHRNSKNSDSYDKMLAVRKGNIRLRKVCRKSDNRCNLGNFRRLTADAADTEPAL